jgi:fermentation-respiration switch protein FrsA (DUF1100 family)
MSDIAWSVARIIGGVYVGLCAVLFFMQKSQIYVPDRDVNSTPLDGGMPFENLHLPASNGETIHAWHIPAKNETRSTIIFCHGNGGNIGGRIGSLQVFHNMGFNVIIFEYQGYGDSTGETTEKNTYDDAMTAWNYLIKGKALQPEDIIIFGRSLGGAVAIQLAEQVQPKLLVTESTFSSAPDMAARMFPFLPSKILCRYKYNSAERIKNIHCPVIIAHGPEDNTVPYAFGKRIFDAANEPKHFVDLEGGHNAGGIDIHKDFQDLFKKLATPKGDI